MVNNYKNLIKDYYKNHSFVESNIKSFNEFIEKGMQQIVNEVGDIIPTIIPQEVENFKIKFGKVSIEKPLMVEADGSKRDIFPVEARLRGLTYSSPINVEVFSLMDNVQREAFTATIGKIPIMVKSKFCHLHGLKDEALVERYEDPKDFGGYFILNGNERVLITVEDLASSKLFVNEVKIGPSKFVGKLFSESGYYRVPHTIEQLKDGIIYLSFSRFKRIPFVLLLKGLGFVRDDEIMKYVSEDKEYDDVFLNLYNSANLKTDKDALEDLARLMGFSHLKEQKSQKVKEQLDRYFLPHLGIEPKDRAYKAYNLCKIIKKYLMVSKEGIETFDKDHYMNKRLKLSGNLMADLFRVNLRSSVQDMLYNFQRLVKRGKFQSIKIIIRDQLIAARIKSAVATGNWPGGRSGISQNIDRTNSLATLSHLQRVVSLLTATQENFEARALHATHYGRLCPVETPEGTPIGLRKNMSLMSEVSSGSYSDEKLKKILEGVGLKSA